ncbi:MAG: response regulator [Sedimentisphaerales bacterium]
MGKKILVVDDETDLLKVTLLRLKKTGYEAFGCADGWGVLDLARKIIPDLIILDVYLPVISGDHVAKILKKDDQLKHIPIILISASTRILDEKTWASGADAYLTKPFEPEQLIGLVKKVLGQDSVAEMDENKIPT